MLDSINHEDFEATNANKMDEQLLVRFMMKSKKDHAASLEAGRPIFNEVEYVEIRIPGKRDTAFAGPATPRHKTRFPKHYAAFKTRTELPVTGTPLVEFPHINRSMADELSFFNIKTVEDLLAMSDTHASKFMGLNKLKTLAKEWLEAADETALLAERDAAREQVTDLQTQMQAMQKQLLEMQAAMAPVEAPVAVVAEKVSVIQPTVLDEPAEPHVPLKSRRKSRAKTKAE